MNYLTKILKLMKSQLKKKIKLNKSRKTCLLIIIKDLWNQQLIYKIIIKNKLRNLINSKQHLIKIS